MDVTDTDITDKAPGDPLCAACGRNPSAVSDGTPRADAAYSLVDAEVQGKGTSDARVV
jgi:hypothetical protein